MNGYQRMLRSALVAALLVSAIRPPYPDQMLLQHIPTVVALLAFAPLARRWPLRREARNAVALSNAKGFRD